MNKFSSLYDHIVGHCSDSLVRALSAERHPLWQRLCPGLSDIDFVRLGVLRVILKKGCFVNPLFSTRESSISAHIQFEPFKMQ